MQSSSKNVAKLVDHPRMLTRRVNEVASDLERVAYSQDINDLASARILSMPQIWDCLTEGQVMHHGLEISDDEARGVISFHSHEGLVKVVFALTQDDSWIEVLSASIEVK
ncbi:hypothetical protein [Pseudomonas sp. DR 5-09]|uniref:hypothetical protein n=1 Tax=Pseudomonas sp. DR 5-09 TaxID=1534110 RepID=UPI0007E34F65|nr:hypothetical protein [Pseudomonas sp. DR 5-09]